MATTGHDSPGSGTETAPYQTLAVSPAFTQALSPLNGAYARSAGKYVLRTDVLYEAESPGREETAEVLTGHQGHLCVMLTSPAILALMTLFQGKYELLSDPNDGAYDKYLIAIGVSDAYREAGSMARPSVEITIAGDTYTLKTLSESWNTETSFRLNKEFDETTVYNRQSKTVFMAPKQDQLIQVQKFDGLQAQAVREFSADGMTEIYSARSVSAIRKYKRVA